MPSKCIITSSATDTTPPQISFDSPKNSATVSTAISVQLTATDNNAVASVNLKIGGASLGEDTLSPYAFTLNPAGFVNGAHTLTATAKDIAGNTATASITITVSNPPDTTAPVTVITAPANGATVNGNVLLAATASDNVAVTKTEVYLDGILKGSSNSSSVSMRWNAKNSNFGSHTISAKGYDAAGNIGTTSITVIFR